MREDIWQAQHPSNKDARRAFDCASNSSLTEDIVFIKGSPYR